MTVRNPKPDMYSLERIPGKLALKTAAEVITAPTTASYLGVRQKSYNYMAETRMEFAPGVGEEAGIVILQSEMASLRFVVMEENGKFLLRVVKFGESPNRVDSVIAETTLPQAKIAITLKIMQRGQKLSFWYALQNEAFAKLPAEADARFLSTEMAGGFVGNTIGMYASANHRDSGNYALFDYFAVTDL